MFLTKQILLYCLFYFLIIGDAIGDMLGSAASEIVGRVKQAFVVGNGLSKEGTRLLGKKLACMTIGDLESLLDLKNIDPVKVAELMKNIADLAKALVCFYCTFFVFDELNYLYFLKYRLTQPKLRRFKKEILLSIVHHLSTFNCMFFNALLI